MSEHTSAFETTSWDRDEMMLWLPHNNNNKKGTIKVFSFSSSFFFFSLLFSPFFGLFSFCCYECDFDSGKPIMNKTPNKWEPFISPIHFGPIVSYPKPPNPKPPIFLALRFIHVYMHNDAHNQISVPFLSLSHLVSSLAYNFLSSIKILNFLIKF